MSSTHGAGPTSGIRRNSEATLDPKHQWPVGARYVAGTRPGPRHAIASTIFSLTLLATVYQNVHLPSGGAVGALFIALLAVLIVFVVLRYGDVAAALLPSRIPAPVGPRVYLSILLGLALQIGVAAWTRPIPASDHATYLRLAARLAAGLRYEHELGLSFWPPGLPLALTPFVQLLGPNAAAAIALNGVLYVVGAWYLWKLGRRLFSEHVALVAIVLFTLWPNRLFLAATASKEMLTLTATLAAISLFVDACMANPRPKGRAFGSGAGIGIAALAQPGLLLVALAWPVVFRKLLRPNGWRRSITILLVWTLGVGAVLGPWMLRNCMQFDGAFCGIATNGGSVFYRANNPMATGQWIREGEVPLEPLPELQRNRQGFEMGIRWIAENPLQAMALSARKVAFLLGSDDTGPYYAIFRGLGGTHADAESGVSPGRRLAYRIAAAVALAFWLFIVSACLNYAWYGPLEGDSRTVPILIAPLVCCIPVFALFESGPQQHVAAMGPLVLLAAAFLCGRGEERTLPLPVRAQPTTIPT